MTTFKNSQAKKGYVYCTKLFIIRSHGFNSFLGCVKSILYHMN